MAKWLTNKMDNDEISITIIGMRFSSVHTCVVQTGSH